MHTSMVPGPRDEVRPGLVLAEGGQSDLLDGVSGPRALSQPLAVMCIFYAAAVSCPFSAINYKFPSIVILSPASLC